MLVLSSLLKLSIIIFNASGSFEFDDMLDNMSWFYDTFYGKKLAIENLYPINQNLECAYCMHPDEIIKLMEADKRILLLLDLGHLKISAKCFDFDFIKNAQLLLDRFKKRIAEIHLSENSANDDEHLSVTKNSKQFSFIKNNSKLIQQYKINLVIESRNSSFGEFKKYILLF